MFAYDFMIRAFEAASIVAIVAGLIGYFLVLRGQTFAGHALSHVGFAGATGAALIGLAPLWGLLGFTVAGGIAMGALGERLSNRDVAIGMVLALALGFGLLFLNFYTAYAAQAMTLLFGNVLAVDGKMLVDLASLSLATLVALGIIARPLLFVTLQPEVAEAHGLPIVILAILFMALVAVAVAESTEIVGVLLVFTLMVGPAAAAQNLTNQFGRGVFLSVTFALAEAWAGIALAYATDWPTSFWISVLSGATYLAAILWHRVTGASNRRASPV
jgi:zinc/manganese transport system permease protein